MMPKLTLRMLLIIVAVVIVTDVAVHNGLGISQFDIDMGFRIQCPNVF